MKLRRSLYARPVIIEDSSAPRRRLDGKAISSGCLAAAVGYGRAGSVAIAEPALVCQAASAGPTAGGSTCPGGPPSWSWRSRLSDCLLCRSSVPLSASLPVRLACRVEGTVSGRIRRGRRCPEGCPIVASIVDAGHDRVDIWTGTRLADVRASSMGAGGHAGRVPALAAAGVGEASMCIIVLSGQGQDGRAAWLSVVGWQAHGRTLGGGSVRRLAVAVRTGSVLI